MYIYIYVCTQYFKAICIYICKYMYIFIYEKLWIEECTIYCSIRKSVQGNHRICLHHYTKACNIGPGKTQSENITEVSCKLKICV